MKEFCPFFFCFFVLKAEFGEAIKGNDDYKLPFTLCVA